MNVYEDPLVKYPSLWGHCTYILLIIFAALKLETAIVILALITGGVFSIFIAYIGGQPDNRLTAFILLSNILYLTCFWIFSNADSYRHMSALLASIAGAVLLFVLYYWLINKNYKLWVGVICMFAVGAISAAPYLILSFFDSHEFTDINEASGLFIFFSIIPIWQILFVLTLAKISKNEPIS